MKKTFLLIIFSVLSAAIYAQNSTDKLIHKADSMKYVFMDNNNKIVSEIPTGRNIEITYDKFFKSYFITYYSEEGKYCYIEFFYVKDNPDGISIRMRDKKNNVFNLIDTLEKHGTLFIQVEERTNGLSAIISITSGI